MRYLPDVIKQLLEVIPSSEPGLVGHLLSISKSAQFAAPELEQMWWRRGAEVLHDRFGDEGPKEDWAKQVCGIWLDKKSN